jgi:murein DD-endopeptidase
VSLVRDAIRESGRARRKPGASPEVRRLGALDLLLVGLAVVTMGLRTPVGGLLWYGVERIRGHEAELPSLTAYFDSGAAVAPPPIEAVAAVAPEAAETLSPDVLPEPWRTATRTTLAQGLPDGITATTPEAALAEIDALWAEHRDASVALEIAVLGPDAFERAVGRARSGGEPDPESLEGHRRYLSGHLARQADRFVGGTLALATALDLGWPLAVPHTVTSPYGERMHPVLGFRKMHDGVDLSVPIGTPVITAQDGVISIVGEGGANGKYVVVDHGFGVRTSYCHLSSTPIAKGTKLAKGETFALSGNTGRSTGPHLHYGVRIAGKTVDPERFRR